MRASWITPSWKCLTFMLRQFSFSHLKPLLRHKLWVRLHWCKISREHWNLIIFNNSRTQLVVAEQNYNVPFRKESKNLLVPSRGQPETYTGLNQKVMMWGLIHTAIFTLIRGSLHPRLDISKTHHRSSCWLDFLR